MTWVLKLLAGRLGPYLLGAAGVLLLSGWTWGALQAHRVAETKAELGGVRADLEAAKAQATIDANRAADAVRETLVRRHAEEVEALQAQLRAHRQAVDSAREENNRLAAQLGEFERELENLHENPETSAYLDLPVPDDVRGRLLNAQRAASGRQAGDR